MKKIASLSDAVQHVRCDGEDAELCATAEALYDDARHEVRVELNSFLCPADIKTCLKPLRPAWLPGRHIVCVPVTAAEAAMVARDLHQNAVRCLRKRVQGPGVS